MKFTEIEIERQRTANVEHELQRATHEVGQLELVIQAKDKYIAELEGAIRYLKSQRRTVFQELLKATDVIRQVQKGVLCDDLIDDEYRNWPFLEEL